MEGNSHNSEEKNLDDINIILDEFSKKSCNFSFGKINFDYFYQ